VVAKNRKSCCVLPWNVTPSGSSYEVDLTLPHRLAPGSNAQVCRDVLGVDDWDCNRTSSSSTSNTVTFEAIKSLSSDWAAGDATLAGAFFADDVRIGSSLTYADGSYRSPTLTRGSYTVATHGEGLYLHELWSDLQCRSAPCFAHGQGVVVSTGAVSPAVNFVLELGGRIGGAVVSSRSGEPVKGVAIHVCSADGEPVIDILTDDNGLYSTPAIRDGLYFVSLGGHQQFVDGADTDGPCSDFSTARAVQVNPGERTDGIDFMLE